jgi:hypothetical protein
VATGLRFYVCRHHFKNKEVIAVHQRIVEESAFKAGVAFGN